MNKFFYLDAHLIRWEKKMFLTIIWAFFLWVFETTLFLGAWIFVGYLTLVFIMRILMGAVPNRDLRLCIAYFALISILFEAFFVYQMEGSRRQAAIKVAVPK